MSSRTKNGEIRVEITAIESSALNTSLQVKDANGNLGTLTTSINVQELKIKDKLLLTLTSTDPLSHDRYEANAKVIGTQMPFNVICVAQGKIVDTIMQLINSVK